MMMRINGGVKRENSVMLCAIINWNGWRDTVTCVLSLLKPSGPSFQLVICDNGSSDDSFQCLSNWLSSEMGAISLSHTKLDVGAHVIRFNGPFSLALNTIYLLRLPKNLGYAGAINRCITWGQEALSARDFWLLNNDVKVNPQALEELIAVARSAPDIGLCGSVLLDWDHPETVQAIGGVYRRCLAVGRHMQVLPAGSNKDGDAFFDIDYPVGASLFVKHDYLEAVGLMDDGYWKLIRHNALKYWLEWDRNKIFDIVEISQE